MALAQPVLTASTKRERVNYRPLLDGSASILVYRDAWAHPAYLGPSRREKPA